MAHLNWVNILLPNSFFWVFITFIFFYLLIQDAMKKLVLKKYENNYSKSSTQESFNIQEQYEPMKSIFRKKIFALSIYLLIISGLVLALILLICTF